MLVREGCIYEMFEYVEGISYNGSLEATASAGTNLGLYHWILRDFVSDYEAPTGSYHDQPAIRKAIRETIRALPIDARPPAERLNRIVSMLEKAYHHCAAKVNQEGLDDWDQQIVHGDWHPGNMLFAPDRVVAVIDYDSARIQQRIIDAANGALQFSIVAGDKDPAKWPDQLDLERFKAFMQGYNRISRIPQSQAKIVPYLMCEAMIAEAVLPIAATGCFGRVEGFAFLEMVARKVKWILQNAASLIAAAGSS